MIIYIPLEIAIRELQGHLLLATVAVSQGHQVLIASSDDLWLYKRLNLLPKGVYLVKNVNIPSNSKEMYKSFLKDGFDIYCHEQEPPILWDSFDKFLHDRNIVREQMCPFKGVFCWGKRDTNGYKSFFETNQDVFVNTGSPRADLWNSRFVSLRKNAYTAKLKPYILMISNFGLLMGNRHWSEWLLVGKKNETIQSSQQEENLIQYILEDSVIALRMVQAVRYLAKQYPSYKIVIRPHPLDDINKWNNIIGEYQNIHVTTTKIPLSSWIADAEIVIQNGCTSALEAVLQKTPVISFGPERVHGGLTVPSHMGIKCETIQELDTVIKICLNANDYAPIQAKSKSMLKTIISTEGCDASVKMLKIIEERSVFDQGLGISHLNCFSMGFVRWFKNNVDWIRRNLMRKNILLPSYQLDPNTITSDVQKIAQIIESPKPNLTFISTTGVLIS